MRSLFAPALLLALSVLSASACVSEMGDGRSYVDTDAGIDAGAAPVRDAPMAATEPDAGAATVAPACTSGCAIVELAAGRAHACARRENGEVLCWGRNRFGELGDGRGRHESCSNRGDVEETDCSGTPVVAHDVTASALSARASASTCALDADGALTCWGVDLVLREGGPTLERARYDAETVPAPAMLVDVSEGPRHTCAVDVDGRVLCRGLGFAGQLGDGDVRDRDAFAPVLGLDDATDVEVAAGGDFSCARTARGVYCWGDASSGQLGDGDGPHEGCGGGLDRFDCARMPARVEGLTQTGAPDIVALSLGASHACALDDEGTVLCWGENAQGQLGVGDDVARTSTPMRVPDVSPAVAISAGATFTCALRADGVVLCWGDDGDGQLGDGDGDGDGDDDDATGTTETCTRRGELTACRKTPAPVRDLAHVVALSAGSAHACALDDTGAVRCWGLNDARQLGDGTRHTRTAPILALPRRDDPMR